MAKKNILLVEDELAIREMIKFSFKGSKYNLHEAEDVKQAKMVIEKKRPDLILLDWMLPAQSGISFAKELRDDKNFQFLPIIMLTAKSEEQDKLIGFNAGIDDYIAKPFSPSELKARIKAVIRRSGNGDDDNTIEIDKLSLNSSTHRVSCDDQELKLGPLEFKLLHYFMSNKERVYSRTQLLDNVWGNDCYIDERTVDVHIRRLRKVLGKCHQEHLIQTVRGSGYRFSSQSP